jgi:hypothetical protein
VSRFIEGRKLTEQILFDDIKRVPKEYMKAVDDLAKLVAAEKKYVLGDRRKDQYIITPDKRAWGFDYQFVGDKSRWESSKNAIPNVLVAIPELLKYFNERFKEYDKTESSFARSISKMFSNKNH